MENIQSCTIAGIRTNHEKYKSCLDAGKTERECIRLTVSMIEEKGYKSLDEVKKIQRRPETRRQGICSMHGQEHYNLQYRGAAAGEWNEHPGRAH